MIADFRLIAKCHEASDNPTLLGFYCKKQKMQLQPS